MKRCVAVVLAAGGVVGVSSLALAQTHTWVGGNGDRWSNPFNWTPQNVPQNAGDSALVGIGSSVLMDNSYSLGGLTIGFAADLRVQNSQALFYQGTTLTNDGLFIVNHNAGPFGTYLRFDNTTTLAGNGRITLNANAGDYNTAYLSPNGTSVTNGANHTIDGVGRIFGNWNNLGTMDSNVPGYSLDFTNGNIINSGTIRATNGAYQTLRSTINQTGSGQIVADNATTYLYTLNYSGGAINAVNGGTTQILSGQVPSFFNVATSGPLNISPGAALVLNSIADPHNGVITVNDSYGLNGTYIRFDQSGTMQGTCTIQLNANASDYNTAYLITNGTTVEFPSTYTVQGRGRLYGSWINSGTWQTTGVGNSLDLPCNVDNRNLIVARDGSYLTLRGPVTQSASGIVGGDASDIYFYTTSYNGGLFSAINGGKLYITNGATPYFSNAALNGPIVIPSGSALLLGTIGDPIYGSITVNETGGPYGTYVRFDQTGTLGGSGAILLNATQADLGSAYLTTNGATVTIPPSWTVQGNGRLYGSYINESLFQTGGAGNSLDFANLFTNNAEVRATNGAYLTPRAGLMQGPSGVFNVQNASTLYLYGTNYSGGTFNATGGSTIEVTGGSVPSLSGVTTNGPINIPSGAALVMSTTGEAHNGVITVNSNGGPYGTYMRFDQSGALAGTQTIILNGSPSDLGTAYLNANASTIAIPPTTTISGTGRFYGSFYNYSTISTIGGGALDFANFFNNQGEVRASFSSYITMPAGFAQFGAGRVTLSNLSNLYLYGTSYTGGRIEADASSSTNVAGGSVPTLTGIRLDTRLSIPTGSAIVFNGDFTQNGVTVINSTEGPYNTYARFDGTTRVDGAANFVLTPYAGDWSVSYLNANGGVATFGPQTSITGTGRFYGSIATEGAFAPRYNSNPIGFVYSYNSFTLKPTATYQVDVGASGVNDLIQGVSTPITLGGSLVINVLPGPTPPPGAQYIVAAGSPVIGTFASVSGPALPNNRRWEMQYTGTQAILFVGCGGDFNRDGFIDFSDFDDFVYAFEAGEARSDFNEDGFLDFTDFDAFIAAFEEGC
ncbi:MAG: GC-type dockerin domain-anchored protein [Planctomycetota bacterium]|nr:GC-type dockerin domain-anchored protein [Planctomycetota bacterium]